MTSKWSPGCFCCGGGGSDPCAFDECDCWNGSAFVAKPDIEVTISGVTNPSSSYLTCTACTTHFNKSIILSCGDQYNDSPTGFVPGTLLCGPSSTVPTCGLTTNGKYGVFGMITADYTNTAVTVTIRSSVHLQSGLGYVATGTTVDILTATLNFDTRTCGGTDYPGGLCTTTRAADATSFTAGCTATDDMVCGISGATISFAVV